MSLAVFDSLFGSRAKARTLRFFLLNADREYPVAEVAEKTLIPRSDISRELKRLAKMKFVSERTRGNRKMYKANENFPFYQDLKMLVSKVNIHAQAQVFRKLKGVGEVKLILISGLFLNYPKSKVDMILVVNNPNRTKLKYAITHLEAELGKEVSFVLMNGDELHYRLNMLDRFFIEFLEGPYEEVVNKVPELKRFIAGLKK
ncbi:MAG: helix-turn-helix domain-containing protein [Candidatus Moraniibacteriota bacterium]